jgi:hypothetical protein
MRYTHGTVLKTFTSGDGTRSVDIVARNDGTYQYFGHKYVNGDAYTGPHWKPTRTSGLYPSADLAESDAEAEMPWIRLQNSN